MTATATAKAEIDPKLVVPIVNSVRNVLSTMAGVQTTVGRPHFATGNESAEYDYSGIIGFSGKLVGSVVVSFPREVAIKLVAAFAGGSLAPDSSDFADAIGELANMIAGAAKSNMGANANITVPNVITGKGHRVSRPSDVPCLVIPCSTPIGNFAVEVAIKPV